MPPKKTVKRLEAIAAEHRNISREKGKIHAEMKFLYEKMKVLNTRAADAVRKEFPMLYRLQKGGYRSILYVRAEQFLAVSPSTFSRELQNEYTFVNARNLIEAVESDQVSDKDILRNIIDLPFPSDTLTTSVSFH